VVLAKVCVCLRDIIDLLVLLGFLRLFWIFLLSQHSDTLASLPTLSSIKVIAPKFEELSEKYTDAVFLKVIGDASPEASKLMKREGVRSVPSFHYFVNGEKVDVINGANAEAIEAAITKITNAKTA